MPDILELARECGAEVRPWLVDRGHSINFNDADQLRALVRRIRDDEREKAANCAAPKGARPCDCEVCDCGNSGDYMRVVDWDTSNALAAAIRRGGDHG